MKHSITQRLFWKRWPYKVLLKFAQDRSNRSSTGTKSHGLSRWLNDKNLEDFRLKSQFRQWFKKHHPEGGIRSESGMSVFLSTQEEVDNVVDAWKKYVVEVWAPSTQASLTVMQDHVYDVVRSTLWYRKFPIRARILYTQEFRHNGLPSLRDALSGMERDHWLAKGLLMDLINEPMGRVPWAWGQPVYLYLLDNEDAIMLKLQAGDYIDRFERIRAP
jgi:hypothetical protein